MARKVFVEKRYKTLVLNIPSFEFNLLYHREREREREREKDTETNREREFVFY